MLRSLKRLDLIFGRQIYLTYAERTYFQTVIGALSTIFLFTTVSTFTIYGILQLHTGKILSISNEEVKYLDKNVSFIPSELGFNMTFGFNSPLPTRIGHFAVEHVTVIKNNGSLISKVEVEQ